MKKIRTLSVLKNLQEPNWDEVTDEHKLDMNKFRIDVKEDDINKYREVLSVILFLKGYCCYAVFKKMKCNSCKDLISGRDTGEINSYFQEINRGSFLCRNDRPRNFVLYKCLVMGKLIKNLSFLHSVIQKEIKYAYSTEYFG